MTTTAPGPAPDRAPTQDRASEPAAAPRPGRIDGIDLARFLAIVGMMVAHLTTNGSFDITEPSTLADPRGWLAVADGRSSTLFGLLAGISIAIISRRPLAEGGAEVPRLRLSLFVRGLFIATLGVLLEEFQYMIAVVLTVYGFVYMVLAFVVRRNPRQLLGLAVVSGLVGTASKAASTLVPTTFWEPNSILSQVFIGQYPLWIWLCFGLVGMAVVRLGMREAAVQRRLVAIGAAMAVVAYSLGAVVTRVWSVPGQMTFADLLALTTEPDTRNVGVPELPATGDLAWQRAVLTPVAHSGGLLDVVGSLGVALAALGVCLLACRNTRFSALMSPLRAAGAMPLTVYLLHVVSTAVVAHFLFWQQDEQRQVHERLEVAMQQSGGESGDELREAARAVVDLAERTTEPKLILLLVSIVAFPLLAALWRRRFGKGPAEELLGRSVAEVTRDRPPVRF